MNGLTCAEFVAMITEFLDGAPDDRHEQEFTGHIAECTGCERYLDQFVETIRLLGESGRND